MSGDCQGTITQTTEEIKVHTDPFKCEGCIETDCPGHKDYVEPGEAPSDSEPGKVYEVPFNAKRTDAPDPEALFDKIMDKDPQEWTPEQQAAIQSLGTLSKQVIADILDGTATGFLIITAGPTQVKEWTYMTPEARLKALTSIAANDLEKKLKNVLQPGYMGFILNDLLNFSK